MTGAGWYPDPGDPAFLRWWDGATWTEYTAASPASVPAPAPAKIDEPPPTFDHRAVIPTVLGVAASVIVGRTLYSFVYFHLGHSPTAAIASMYIPLFGGMAATCRYVSRKFGTGRFAADFGWTFRGTDVWRGLLILVIANIAAAIVTVVARQDQISDRTSRELRIGVSQLPVSALFVLALSAIIAAPLLEEIAFRGILQRSLTGVVGVWWAVAIQAVLFGLYHFAPELGRDNFAENLGRAVVGFVFGVATMRWRRLGPSTVAHVLVNSFFVLAVVSTR